MALPAAPVRIFLDTSVVNFLLDYGEQIHDGTPPPAGASRYVVSDIHALSRIWESGQRSPPQLIVSRRTFEEVASTSDPVKRGKLLRWFEELEDSMASNSGAEQPDYVPGRSRFRELPGDQDCELLCDALAYGCDSFCTRDWKTILRLRNRINDFPVRVISPREWWALLQQHAVF